MRPPGYEPGELPTAPLRDHYFLRFCQRVSLLAGAKVQLFMLLQGIIDNFSYSGKSFLDIYSIKRGVCLNKLLTKFHFHLVSILLDQCRGILLLANKKHIAFLCHDIAI